MSSDLNFLLEEPTVPFRAIKRKGELRYIASNRCGSLGAMTRFAPPSKPLPGLLIKLLSAIDFRIPQKTGLIVPLNVSDIFLNQAAALLDIPVNRVGVYVGEPNDRRKLVVTDIEGQSTWVLKLAVGRLADEAIRREAQGAMMARGDQRWVGMVPAIRQIESVSGLTAILIERIRGMQLSPDEFEDCFFSEEGGFAVQSSAFFDPGVSVEEWLEQNLPPATCYLSPALASCRETGAFSLCSSLGVVHGDFAPWNVIRRKADVGGWQGEKGSDQGSDFGCQSLPPAADLPTAEKSKVRCLRPDPLCVIDWEFSRADTPLIFDIAYAVWCYSELLNRTVKCIDPILWKQLVALGALWQKIREDFSEDG